MTFQFDKLIIFFGINLLQQKTSKHFDTEVIHGVGGRLKVCIFKDFALKFGMLNDLNGKQITFLWPLFE